MLGEDDNGKCSPSKLSEKFEVIHNQCALISESFMLSIVHKSTIWCI
jgi:hypothetical protein